MFKSDHIGLKLINTFGFTNRNHRLINHAMMSLLEKMDLFCTESETLSA
jgi:hypothetical protein